MNSYKSEFSRFFAARPDRLHAAAHSHHPWPDVSRVAHIAAWDDAMTLADRKWEPIFGRLIPELGGRIAAVLGLPDPGTLAFAPNTHELVVRLRSCLPRPARILTTDAEFHSFSRQARRWQEAGDVEVVRVAAEPLASFPERMLAAAVAGDFDLIYLSQVFFNSGYVVPLAVIEELAAADAVVAVDGYHGFMAVPTSLGSVADRVFYLAGGYKYAMSGEGACFMHCPPGICSRPVNTGWFADFGDLAADQTEVGYGAGGQRFAGATIDPTALYRMNAVLAWLPVSVAELHERVRSLQARFLAGVDPAAIGELIPGADAPDRGNFLTFRTPRAGELFESLLAADVITDHRGDRLRFGFGLYHDPGDIDQLISRVRAVL